MEYLVRMETKSIIEISVAFIMHCKQHSLMLCVLYSYTRSNDCYWLGLATLLGLACDAILYMCVSVTQLATVTTAWSV